MHPQMVALSMADGFARLTGKPQAVIVHVDVGTQTLGCGLHNASAGRCPVLIFAGLSPMTLEGELPGSRTEYIHWLQDVPDQKQIVAQYCRYVNEIRTGRNVKQVVNRALQFAASDPQGPVYLTATREVLEEHLTPYELDQSQWSPVLSGSLPHDGVVATAQLLISAINPLIIVGYSGRQHSSVPELVKLADTVPGVKVLDCLGSDASFPSSHPASLGVAIGSHEAITAADFILVVHADIPWIPTRCKPSRDCKIVHIDIDPLKQNMPLFYIPAQKRYRADAASSFRQLHEYIASTYPRLSEAYSERKRILEESQKKRLAGLALSSQPTGDLNPVSTSYLGRRLRETLPPDTIWCLEAVTNASTITNQLQVDIPGHLVNAGGGGLGWSGGATLGVKLATDHIAGGTNKGHFVCEVVGDGTYMFGVPGTVYWVARRYQIATLTVVLNNKGKCMPKD